MFIKGIVFLAINIGGRFYSFNLSGLINLVSVLKNFINSGMNRV